MFSVLFDSTQVKPDHSLSARELADSINRQCGRPRPRRFGEGLLAYVPLERVNATAADLAWWAANSPSNLAAPDYDRMAQEAEWQAHYDRGFVPC